MCINCKKVSMVLLLFFSVLWAKDTERESDLFSGGMAGHFGYSSIKNRYGEFSGPTFGLGGLLHFYVHKNVRIGSGGASVWMNYETGAEAESYMRLGYGGLMTELSFPVKSWRFSVGALVGGGAYKNLHILSENRDGTETVSYVDEGTMVYSPLVAVERNLTNSIKCFIMADYLMGPKISFNGNLGGPKFLVGILFRK